ncbi:orexin [Epinephelus moara]|uniref:Hypocretin neuropeptide precursor n=1 Tax=Epinephelus coioides TaxID=94232 RepID=E1AQZ0_EPICO|nr:orexin [Epinephelus moara]ADM26763.1 hypocretin neuropeptide precursor protein [Epinephelus coioides]
MASLHTSQKMPWVPTNLQTAAGKDMSNRKVLVLVLMLLLSQLACDAHSVSECCRQPPRNCRLHVLLCRSGSKNLGGTLTGDAAAGILTLGKRREDDRLQSRLHQLLQGSRNQAAGILTMGKRTEEMGREQYIDWMTQSRTFTTPLPVLN